MARLSPEQLLTLHLDEPNRPAPRRSGGFAGFLPLIGGIAGGAVGTAIAPGVGTAAGGAGGSALGEALRQLLQGEEFSGGKLAGEAALGALPGVLRVGGRAIKGARAAKAGLSAGDTGSRVAQTGKSLRRAATVPKLGTSPTAFSDAERITELASGFKGSGTAKLKQLDAEFRSIEQTIEKTLPSLTKRVPGFKNNLSSYIDELPEFSASDPKFVEAKKKILDLAKRYKGDVQGVNAFRKELGNLAKRGFKRAKSQAGTPLTPFEELATSTYRRVNELIGEHAPELRELVRRQGELFEIAPHLSKLANTTRTIGPVPFNVAPTIQRGSDLTGRLLEGAAGTGAPSVARNVGARTLEQSLVRVLSGAQGQPSEPVEGFETAPTPSFDTEAPQSEAQGLEQALVMLMLQDLEATGGKNIGELNTVLGALQSMQPKQKPLTAEQLKQKNNAESGLRAIAKIESELNRDPNVVFRGAIPGRPAARQFDVARNEALDVLTRLRTGAALTANEEKFYRSQLPQPFDSPETVAYKLSLFRDLFTRIASPEQASASLEDLSVAV